MTPVNGTKSQAHRLTQLNAILCVGLPFFWLSGVFVTDMARVLAAVVICGLFIMRRSPIEFRASNRQTMLLAFFLVAYVVMLYLFDASQLARGKTGVDFAIFTQVVHNWGALGTPTSTLIGLEPQNFLTHHFVPLLIIPSLVARAGLDAGTAIIWFHAVCFALTIICVVAYARSLDYSPFLSAFFAVLLVSNPTIRHAVFFEVHDEVFAMPFIAFAWWMGRRQKWTWMAAGLLLASMTKESMFAVVAGFGMMTWREAQDQERGDSCPKHISIGLILYGLTGFIAYFFLQPLILNKGFDHASKLASFEEFFRPDWFAAKCLFTGFLFLPFLAMPLWQRKYLYLLLPALPLVGLVWVSKFPEMWKLLNYYSVVPSLVLGLVSIDISAKERWIQNKNFTLYLTLALCLTFSFSERRPTREIIKNLQTSASENAYLQTLPADSRVIASSGAVPHLLQIAHIQRLNHAEIEHYKFDFIVTAPDDTDKISSTLINASKICHQDTWTIRCKQ